MVERLNTLKVTVDNDFYILVVDAENEGYSDFWLMRKGSAHALHMFGLSNEDEAEFEDLAIANAPAYIPDWEEEVEDAEERFLEELEGDSFKEFYKKSNMSIREISDEFGIPFRTVQNWAYEQRTCPKYLLDLMWYKIKTRG